MSVQTDDDFYAALSVRSIHAEIDRHILLTENNRELASLGAVLLKRSLNILTALSPSDTLKSAVCDMIDETGDKYAELNECLESLTSDVPVIK